MKSAVLLLLPLSLACGLAAAQTAPSHATPAMAPMGHGTMAMDTTPSATPAKVDAFAALDANHDGLLSQSELAKHPMAAHAGMVDASHDGRLDRKEFAALQGM